MTESSQNKPDWSNLNMDEKMNLLLDISFKNSQQIQNFSDSLSKHSEDIKKLSEKFEMSNDKITKLSEDLTTVNGILAEVSEQHASSVRQIKKLTDNVSSNTKKCEENFNSIVSLNSKMDSLIIVPNAHQQLDSSSSQMGNVAPQVALLEKSSESSFHDVYVTSLMMNFIHHQQSN
ncbi:hypothetical protein KQX54_016200 [Cotesia glomerata]|uniref:Uncharacterized protein n=1 Tax=Cotesia glomerata TaxID=32391 RepID=A0AAV7I2R0_COTGL|nr:hypothetical protein KQX54_016200 [Cotesia glomerata]